jgi:lactose/L-arabinose transport system permease protein
MRKSPTKIVIYIVLTAVSIVSVFPFIWTIIASTHSNTQLFNLAYTLTPKGNFFANLKILEASMPIWHNLFNSIFITVVYTTLVLVVDSMAGYGFTKFKFKGQSVLFFGCLVTMMIPQQVTMVPMFIQMTKFHWISSPLAIITPWLAGVFGVFLMRQNFQSFPDELIESARIDGASELRTFISIVAPAMKPAFASLGILSFVQQWGNYLWPLIVLNSDKSYTLPLALSMLVAPGNVINYGAVMVGAVLALLPVLIFFLIFQKNFINGMMSGAIKG